eukprot:747537-Hanusia_phi.AAC.1
MHQGSCSCLSEYHPVREEEDRRRRNGRKERVRGEKLDWEDKDVIHIWRKRETSTSMQKMKKGQKRIAKEDNEKKGKQK